MNDLLEFGTTLSHSAVPGACGWPVAASLANTTMPMLVIYDSTATWVIEAARKLDALGRLRPGWDSHGGLPLRPEAKEGVVEALTWLKQDPLPVPAVVLCSGGTVQLEWKSRNKELDVEVGGPNALDFVMVHPDGSIEEGVEQANPREKLEGLARWLRQR